MENRIGSAEDSYNLWVPIEDTDLLKSVSVDENGDFIVQGVMTSDDKDEEDDSITPTGMDCSYFLNKGWIKYEHGNNPNQFIGEPLEVKVGQFEHPKLKKSVHGVFVKGRLFAHRDLTKQAVQAIEDLQKSNTKRCMGWSIEGNVKERDRKSGKIVKSVLRNVVLTMNPINTVTWAELSKSFATHHEVEVDMEKAMDTGAMAEVMPQSIEDNKPENDPQEDWIKTFRAFVKSNALQKSARNEFIANSDPEWCGYKAYTFAKSAGMVQSEALDFASYIAERHETLKSLFGKIGGETMSAEAKNKLASMLDTDLDELQKSLELDEEDDELEKSVGDDEGGNDEDDDDSDESKEGSDDDDDDDDDDNDEDDDTEKSVSSELRKSLTEEHGHGQAFEVSDVLKALVDELGFGMEGLQKSMGHMTKQQGAIVKALTSSLGAIQTMSSELEAVKAENSELRKSFDELLQRPVGRQSVVNQREVTTLTKSMGSEGSQANLSRAQIGEILEKSFDAGELSGKELIRFNAGVPVTQLVLPEAIKTKVGL